MLDHHAETSDEWSIMADLMIDRLQAKTRLHPRRQLLIENLQGFLHQMPPDQLRQAVAKGRVTVSDRGEVYIGHAMPQPAPDGEICLKWGVGVR